MYVCVSVKVRREVPNSWLCRSAAVGVCVCGGGGGGGRMKREGEVGV